MLISVEIKLITGCLRLMPLTKTPNFQVDIRTHSSVPKDKKTLDLLEDLHGELLKMFMTSCISIGNFSSFGLW